MSGRKALLRAYKERKVEAGIYAVRCTATGEAGSGRRRTFHPSERGLVLAAPGLGMVRKACRRPGTRMALRLRVRDGRGRDTEGWTGSGASSCSVKDRRDHWIAALNATGLM
ncbi:GIY-YIG nuclease family protein [Caulobacter segnis]